MFSAPEGEVLAERSVVLEKCSNNIAEYEGLILAIETSLEFEDDDDMELEILSDSQLIVNQVNGEWKCKNEELQPYLAQARDLASLVTGSVSISWVRRNFNQRADALCRVAMKSFVEGEQEIGQVRSHSPVSALTP